jgi:hypothetical protein
VELYELGLRVEGLQHMLQAVDNGQDEAAYMFGILTVEYNNLVVEAEEALVHVDKFIILWGHQFFNPLQDLPQCHTLRSQYMIYRNVWKSERWMTSCSWTC